MRDEFVQKYIGCWDEGFLKNGLCSRVCVCGSVEIWQGLHVLLLVSCLFAVLCGPAELVVDGVGAVVEVGRLLAGQGVQGEGAHKGRLVEHGLVGAEEAPLEHLLLAVGVHHRVADVEHLARVVYVGVVAVAQAVAREGVNQVSSDVQGAGGEAEGGGDRVLGGTIILVLSLLSEAGDTGHSSQEQDSNLEGGGHGV